MRYLLFESTEKKMQVRNISCIAITMLVLGYFIMLKPHLARWSNAKQLAVQLKSRLAHRQQLIALMGRYQQQLTHTQQQLRRTLQLMALKYPINQLMGDVFTLGEKHAVTLIFFAPQAEIQRTFYTILPIKMILHGEYHHLVLFLSHIVHLPYLVTFGDFNLYKNSKRVAGSSLTMNIDVFIYKLYSQPTGSKA